MKSCLVFFSIHRDIVKQGHFKNLIFGFEKLIQNNKQLRLKKELFCLICTTVISIYFFILILKENGFAYHNN